MKRITRTILSDLRRGERVWLNKDGRWTFEKNEAFEFEDEEANKRVRRLPHAEVEDVKKENDDVQAM